jgi:hypothetical protein
LQKSKSNDAEKSRESRSLDFSATASLFNATTEVRDRFWMKPYGPSRRRALDASAALRIFVRHPEKTFSGLRPSFNAAAAIGAGETAPELRISGDHAKLSSRLPMSPAHPVDDAGPDLSMGTAAD